MSTLAYAETVLSGQAGYAPTAALLEAWTAGRCSRVWRLGPRIVSVQLRKAEGGGIWKARERLPLTHPGPMLDTLEAAGIKHPSSFADCYHQLAEPVRHLPWTYNGMLHWWPGGPWEEARRTGEHRGNWFRYDLVSAYRWAATLGLPDPATYRVETRASSRPGIWIFQPSKAREDLPAIYRQSRYVVISTEEIDAYKLTGQIIRGITWEKTLPPDYVERTLGKLPCHKEAGRAYWGRWVARDRLTCMTAEKEWSLPNMGSHFVWGWLIVGRVRCRVWQDSQRAAHVYVDEVLVPHSLNTGDRPGDWHLKEHYPRGVAVYRTGCYGPRGGKPVMQTGVSRN
jgi:hypothetical protein